MKLGQQGGCGYLLANEIVFGERDKDVIFL